MLDDPGPEFAEALLLPGLGIVRHVHLDLEAEGAAHHADAEAEIAGAADRDRVPGEEFAEGSGCERRVGQAGPQQPRRPGQRLGIGQDLVDPAPRLDAAGNRQIVVGLDPDGAGRATEQGPGEVGCDRQQGRVDPALVRPIEQRGQERREAAPARLRARISASENADAASTDAASRRCGLRQIVGSARRTGAGIGPSPEVIRGWAVTSMASSGALAVGRARSGLAERFPPPCHRQNGRSARLTSPRAPAAATGTGRASRSPKPGRPASSAARAAPRRSIRRCPYGRSRSPRRG